MTPEEIDSAELPLECLAKMSVAQLEQFVSFIVKRSCGSGENSNHVATRPNWWPRELAFRYPVARRNITDLTKWRETLLDVLCKCPYYRCPEDQKFRRNDKAARKRTHHNCAQLRRRSNKTKKQKQVPSSDSSTGSSENYGSKTLLLHQRVHEKVALSEQQQCFVRNLKYAPVVSLCNVLQHPCPTRKPCDTIKSISKNQFLNYFSLGDNSTQTTTVIKQEEDCVHKPSHPIHLFNSQQVPISSDLGIRLTKECNMVSQEVHQKKLERVERYLSTTAAVSTSESAKSDFEIMYNKKPHYTHTYFFPSRQYRNRKFLSSKALFLLERHCKPCTVYLEKLKNITEPEIINSNNLPNNILHESNLPTTTAPPTRPISDEDIFTARLFRNENIVADSFFHNNNNNNNNNNHNNKNNDNVPLIGTPKSVAAILLKPLAFLSHHSPLNLTSNTIRKKSTASARRENRIRKRRVCVYYPRRFSLRLRFRAKKI